jgi:prepilin peptidase CpaA
MSLLATGGILAYLALATYWDLRERRIPNRLSALAFLAALAIAPTGAGAGLSAALLGAAVGVAALLAPFLLQAVGAGDVKFAGVVGAWLGPQAVLCALLLGTAAGLFVALGYAAAAGRVRHAIQGAARIVWMLAATLSLTDLPAASAEESRLAPIPYAVPLAAGALAAVLLDHQGWLRL